MGVKKAINVLGRLIFLFIIAIVSLFILVFIGLHLTSHTNKISKKTYGIIPTYQIVEKKKYDAPVKAQYVLQVMVSGNVTKQSLKNLLNKLYDSVKDDHSFKYYKRPTNIYIYVYTSKAKYKTGYEWVASAQKDFDKAPVMVVSESEIEAYYNRPRVKFGLTEKQRINIWKEILIANQKAINKARDKGISEKELISIYKKEIAKKYGLTLKQLNEIEDEGTDKGWPFPKM